MSTAEQQLEQWSKDNIALYNLMDITFNSVSNGLYKVTLPMSKNVSNHVNSIHAAFIWASAEVLGGMIGITERADPSYAPLLKSMDVEFVNMATTDIIAESHFSKDQAVQMNASMLQDGRYDFELNTEIKDINGQLIAKAKALYAVRIIK